MPFAWEKRRCLCRSPKLSANWVGRLFQRITHYNVRSNGFGSMDMSAPKVTNAIVAAMEREVHALVKYWRIQEKEHSGRQFRFFENEQTVVVCGGIGSVAARRAT